MIPAVGNSVSFLITAKDMASRQIRGVGRAFGWLALQARLAERSMTHSFLRGTSEFKLWLKVILLGLPLIPPLLAATANAAGGMVSALVAMGPGVAALAASVIGNFQKIKKEAGLGDLKNAWGGFLKDTRPTALRTLTIGFRILGSLLERLTPIANAFGRVFNTWLRGVEKAMNGPAFDKFLKWVRDVGSVNFGNTLRGMESLFSGIGKLAMGFSDSGLDFTKWFETTMQDFEDWAGNLKNNKSFKAFLEYFRQTWPSVKEMFKELGAALANIIRAVAPWSDEFANGLAAVFRTIANADPAHIRAVVLALLGFRAVNAAITGALWALTGVNMALGRYKRKSDDADGAHKKNQKGFAAVGRGGFAAKLGILGLTTAIIGFAETAINKDKKVADSWQRLKSAGKRLGRELEQSLGPSLRTILTKTFNGLATGAEKAADALPLIKIAAQLAARGALAAIEVLMRGMGRLFEMFARTAAKLAPFNPALGRVAQAMAGAAGTAYRLADAIRALRSKSITVSTTFITNHIDKYQKVLLAQEKQYVNSNYATGGRPAVGRASWVGERGPELFVPDVPGTIVPAHKAESAAAAATQDAGSMDIAKVVARELAKALSGATLRLVDGEGSGKRAYLLIGGNY